MNYDRETSADPRTRTPASQLVGVDVANNFFNSSVDRTDENRRRQALNAAIELCRSAGFGDVVENARKIEAYLKGDKPQPDPTFKNEVLNDVDA